MEGDDVAVKGAEESMLTKMIIGVTKKDDTIGETDPRVTVTTSGSNPGATETGAIENVRDLEIGLTDTEDESYQAEVAPGERPPEKQKPNFKPTGLLAKEANTVAGTATVLKYHEPPEARKPPPREAWRLYVFKGKDMLDTVSLSSRSAWLIGRDPKVTDYPIDHPSVSKQHAVIQFRHRSSKNEFGDVTNKVKPYLIDLESANGTHLNGKKIEASRYIELVDQDVVKFGDSEREYVVMLPPAEK
ncbi:Smad nuclear-interacting 1 [Lecanosticta acicola]|uniref:Smad nuclear-interacting 1 n=1 Tax=Lecanosticta acicola TaxID=111012 RepID=A0AAI9EC53_9PEZI|nr:Smad nuclear-interacting 1 [Lecanosticta acicola]